MWSRVRRFGAMAVALILIEYLAVPQIVHITSDLTILADAAPVLLLIGLVLEICSVASYTALTRAVLPARVRPRFSEQLRIDVTGLGFSHIVPGGGASAAALRFRLMTTHGVPARDAAATTAVQTVVAAIGLVATFVAGVALAGPGVLDHQGYAVAGAVAVMFLLAVAFGMRSLGRHPLPPDQLVGLGRAGARAAATTMQRARIVVTDPRRRVVVLGWAASNWLLDAAALWICLWAYGVSVHPPALLMAYGAANLVGLLPLTPGGLGVIEGILIPALVALGGVALAPATLGVLTWRLLQFWLPIPVAGLTYLSLTWRPRGSTRSTGRQDHGPRHGGGGPYMPGTHPGDGGTTPTVTRRSS